MFGFSEQESQLSARKFWGVRKYVYQESKKKKAMDFSRKVVQHSHELECHPEQICRDAEVDLSIVSHCMQVPSYVIWINMPFLSVHFMILQSEVPYEVWKEQAKNKQPKMKEVPCSQHPTLADTCCDLLKPADTCRQLPGLSVPLCFWFQNLKLCATAVVSTLQLKSQSFHQILVPFAFVTCAKNSS